MGRQYFAEGSEVEETAAGRAKQDVDIALCERKCGSVEIGSILPM